MFQNYLVIKIARKEINLDLEKDKFCYENEFINFLNQLKLDVNFKTYW